MGVCVVRPAVSPGFLRFPLIRGQSLVAAWPWKGIPGGSCFWRGSGAVVAPGVLFLLGPTVLVLASAALCRLLALVMFPWYLLGFARSLSVSPSSGVPLEEHPDVLVGAGVFFLPCGGVSLEAYPDVLIGGGVPEVPAEGPARLPSCFGFDQCGHLVVPWPSVTFGNYENFPR